MSELDRTIQVAEGKAYELETALHEMKSIKGECVVLDEDWGLLFKAPPAIIEHALLSYKRLVDSEIRILKFKKEIYETDEQ
jgi:hypothetical protein